MSDQAQRSLPQGGTPAHPLRALLRRCRLWLDRYPSLRWMYRLAVAVLGTVIVVLGVFLIPLPGPGWLVVFIGVACLGSEFPAAHRVSAFMKRMFTRALAGLRSRRAAGATPVIVAE